MALWAPPFPLFFDPTQAKHVVFDANVWIDRRHTFCHVKYILSRQKNVASCFSYFFCPDVGAKEEAALFEVQPIHIYIYIPIVLQLIYVYIYIYLYLYIYL